MTALSPTARAQDETTEAEQAEIRRGLLQSVSDYRFKLPKTDQSLRLLPDALLRWSNPISGVRDGVICGWVDPSGRPAVLAQAFLTRRGEVAHEFQSVAAEPIEGTIGGQLFWQPDSPAIEFHSVSAGTNPSESKVLRMTRMRRIADRFSGEVEFKIRPEDSTTSTYTLRLLNQPIYRYGSEDGKLVDGAVFALVQGTNPEAWILVEARREGSQLQWYYAVAPMTGYTVRVKGPDHFIFECQNQQATRGRKDLSYLFRLHAPRMESKK
ncbi:MAG: hypothetical protein ACTHK7_20975 [Aureliella sp.]